MAGSVCIIGRMQGGLDGKPRLKDVANCEVRHTLSNNRLTRERGRDQLLPEPEDEPAALTPAIRPDRLLVDCCILASVALSVVYWCR